MSHLDLTTCEREKRYNFNSKFFLAVSFFSFHQKTFYKSVGRQIAIKNCYIMSFEIRNPYLQSK